MLQQARAVEAECMARVDILYALYRLGDRSALMEALELEGDAEGLVRCNVVNGLEPEWARP